MSVKAKRAAARGARLDRVACEATLRAKCLRLYDGATPADERRDLSLEVSILRSQLAGVRDPLAAMMRASHTDEEC